MGAAPGAASMIPPRVASISARSGRVPATVLIRGRTIALLTDTGVLAATPLFGELTDEQRKLVAFGARRRELRAGDVLHREGRAAEGATVVLRGTLELENEEGARDEAQAATLLDELALISRRSHEWTATAATDAVVLPVDRTLFRRLLEEFPDIATRVRTRIAERLAHLADEMEPVAKRMEAAERLTRRPTER